MGIERLGKEMAANMLQNKNPDPDTILVFDNSTMSPEKRLSLQALSYQNKPTEVLYDEFGSVYTTRWRQGTLTSEKDYEQLYPTNGVVNLHALPKTAKVSEFQIIEISDGIEGAIRQQMSILESYRPGGNEINQAVEVIKFTDKMACDLISGQINQDALDRMSQETADFLHKIGLVNPRNEDKAKILEMLKKATHRDSLARINTPAERLRIRSAYLAAVRRTMVASAAYSKFNANLNALLGEREQTRWALLNAYDQIGVVMYELEKGTGQPEACAGLLKTAAYHHLSRPKLKPYLSYAREAALSLVTCNPDKVEINRQIIGAGLADGVMERVSAVKHLENGDTSEAVNQIAHASFLINSALRRGDQIQNARL